MLRVTQFVEDIAPHPHNSMFCWRYHPEWNHDGDIEAATHRRDLAGMEHPNLEDYSMLMEHDACDYPRAIGRMDIHQRLLNGDHFLLLCAPQDIVPLATFMEDRYRDVHTVSHYTRSVVMHQYSGGRCILTYDMHPHRGEVQYVRYYSGDADYWPIHPLSPPPLPSDDDLSSADEDAYYESQDNM